MRAPSRRARAAVSSMAGLAGRRFTLCWRCFSTAKQKLPTSSVSRCKKPEHLPGSSQSSKARGLDKKAGLDLEITEFASPEAAKIALLGGAADIILSDWLWVARQRNLEGAGLCFRRIRRRSARSWSRRPRPSRILPGYRGKKIAVAGGPLDKSWLYAPGLRARAHVELASEAEVIYGAPALLYQKAVNGEVDATLNYWNFCVALAIARVPAAHRHGRGGKTPWRQRAGRHGRLCLRRRFRAEP